MECSEGTGLPASDRSPPHILSHIDAVIPCSWSSDNMLAYTECGREAKTGSAKLLTMASMEYSTLAVYHLSDIEGYG